MRAARRLPTRQSCSRGLGPSGATTRAPFRSPAPVQALRTHRRPSDCRVHLAWRTLAPFEGIQPLTDTPRPLTRSERQSCVCRPERRPRMPLMSLVHPHLLRLPSTGLRARPPVQAASPPPPTRKDRAEVSRCRLPQGRTAVALRASRQAAVRCRRQSRAPGSGLRRPPRQPTTALCHQPRRHLLHPEKMTPPG